MKCGGEAFAIIGINAFIHTSANASPLLFQTINYYRKQPL